MCFVYKPEKVVLVINNMQASTTATQNPCSSTIKFNLKLQKKKMQAWVNFIIPQKF